MNRHSLQRLDSPARSTSALIHVVGLASFQASFWYLYSVPNPLYEGYGGAFNFLTILGLALARITFFIGLLADLTLSSTLCSVKNALSVCSAPLEVLISILYWGLCAINRELVVPPGVALTFLPDIGFHAMPALMLTLDLLLLSPPWTIKAYSAMTLSMTLAVLYWIWVEHCFSRNGWYPYPILEVLGVWQRALLFSFSALLMAGSTMMLKWVYGKLNGIEEFKKEATNPLKLD